MVSHFDIFCANFSIAMSGLLRGQYTVKNLSQIVGNQKIWEYV
jgi:hypothetical protein